MRIFIEQCFGGDDKPRRAKAALRRAVIDERLLDWMQRAIRAGDAFDGGDVRAIHALHQDEARAHGFAILDDHATATVPSRAAVLDAGEAQLVAQNVHEFCVRRCGDAVWFAIHRQGINLRR